MTWRAIAAGPHHPGCADLFANVDMTLDSQSRVCLLGENGDGKTTLVKVMLGQGLS
jgi:ATPase subunit of ABC transporter with duplicated ATPase domains